MIEVGILAEVFTGNVPIDAMLFKLIILEEDLPVWRRCGAYDVILNYTRKPFPDFEIPKEFIKTMLLMSLVHLCANPDVYLSGIVIPADLDFRSNQYMMVIKELASFVQALEKFPASKVLIKEGEDNAIRRIS